MITTTCFEELLPARDCWNIRSQKDGKPSNAELEFAFLEFSFIIIFLGNLYVNS